MKRFRCLFTGSRRSFWVIRKTRPFEAPGLLGGPRRAYPRARKRSEWRR